MFTRLLAFSIIFSFVLSAKGISQTAVELDVKEAQLKELNNRGKDLATAHGSFVVIRDVRLSGSGGFQADIKNWFADASKWMSSWETVINALNDQNLANGGMIDATKQEVQEQLNTLSALRKRMDETRAKGLEAQSLLAQIPRYNTNYIKFYGEQIQVLNSQMDNLQAQTGKSLDYFAVNSSDRMEEMANKLAQLVSSKSAQLALSYPELAVTLRDVEAALNTIKFVDRYVSEVNARSLVARKDLLDGRVYRAMAGLENLKTFAQSNEKLIKNQKNVPEQIRNNGVAQIEKEIADTQAEFTNQLAFSPANKRFAAFYDRQLFGRFDGMVIPCRAAIPPKNLDCLLLKSIAGFTSAHLQAMTDGQLAYLEQTLLKVKEGPIHTPSQVESK